MRVLPPPFAKAIDTMHWSLDTSPLYYQSLEQMEQNRAKDSEQHPLSEFFSLSPNTNTDKNSIAIQDTLDTLFGTISTTDDDNDNNERIYFGWISLALILLGHGWTDECHNLVTPLSWPDDIAFAHGPSRYAAVSPQVQTYATYVHSLV